MLDLSGWKIYLASKSPRRSELLSQAGFEYEIYSKDVEEIYPTDHPVELVPEFLAELKANACSEILNDQNDLIISADSIVIIDGKVVGKPKDRDDAVNILKQLSDNFHTVITGVALKTLNKIVTFSECAEVLFYPLDDAEIQYYIDKFNPMDKAGAYGIQDWIGLCKVREIKGNFSNIMGLPVSRLYHELEVFIEL